MTDLYYGIAAYNEEERLTQCLDSLAKQRIDANLETLICLNGCTDNTEKVALKSAKDYPHLNIRVLHSAHGLVYAQNHIIRSVENRNAPILFVDADVSLDEHCVPILLEELKSLDQLLVVGGWPVPAKPAKMSARESFLFHTLHVRALFPESEVSINDVSEFKSYAVTHPQPRVSAEFEQRSKIYFHGRVFMLRNADVHEMPEDRNLADDSFLPNMIHHKHGPGVIRTRFDATAHYQPYLSLKEHFKTYRRIYMQKRYLDRTNPQFAGIRELERTRLDWKFIFSQPPGVIARFVAYTGIRSVEELAFRVLPKHEPSSLWQYDKK